LTEIAFWHLFLVHNQADVVRYQWQKADAPVSPGRVRQSISTILFLVGSPAEPPRPRGNSPDGTKDAYDKNENAFGSSTKRKKRLPDHLDLASVTSLTRTTKVISGEILSKLQYL
jgi:hypothetical protein